MWRWLRGIRERRDAQAAEHVDAVHAECIDNPSLVLVRVVKVYQKARRGTKAIVVHEDDGRPQDTWFERMRPRVGSYYLVQRCSAWGPHNSNPDTLYVHWIGAHLTRRMVKAANRHHRRWEKAGYRASAHGR